MTPALLPWAMAGIALVTIAVLFGLVARSRGEAARLRRALSTAAVDLERLQLSFSRFAPQAVVESIIARGVTTTADRKEVTILFADLVGFTPLSERLDPNVLVDVLNGYFTRMTRVVADHRGHVSKFIGDGMLALFGALERNPWQANDAVQAALAMQDALAAYNGELQDRGLPALRVGIGVHAGNVVAGVIGSSELMEFTVVGSPVNLAARVEELTRVYDAGILVTDAVRQGLGPNVRLRELPPTPVAGVAEPVQIFAVEGLLSDPSADGERF